MKNIRMMIDGKCGKPFDMEDKPMTPPNAVTHMEMPLHLSNHPVSDEKVVLNDTDGMRVAICETEAEASFILNAVNNHESLVSCLKSCRFTMNTARMPTGHIDKALAASEGKV